jgi:hypothetical protein
MRSLSLKRSRRYFRLSEYASFLEKANQAGILFSLFDCAQMSGDQGPFHYLKHDIHHDLPNTIKVAELEAKLGITASFFMMHRHDLNRKYYDSPSTWQALRDIQSFGHEIAIHVDGFLLIEKYNDLAVGITEEIRKFTDEGLRIRGGNTHGNSQYQAMFNFEPMSFYREVIRPNYCTDARWNAHYGRYSLQALGFEFWADTAVWFAPDKVMVPEMFVSDNSTGWNMGRSTSPEWLMVGPPYNLPPDYADKLIDQTQGTHCIYLVHPQFYAE